MLKMVQIGYALPVSYPVDASSTFVPGQIGQLKMVGNDIVCGLSDGTAPIGIIDDVRTRSFTQTVYDEIVIIQGTDIYTDGYNFFNGSASKQELRNAGIVASSFVADYEGLILNSVNGILTVPADSVLNWDNNGDGQNDSIKTIVNYVYNVPDISGDDSTIGSGRLTLWFNRGIFITDQYDPVQRYVLNATLFVNEEGKLTSKQLTEDHPSVGVCLGPPSSVDSSIQFLWI